MAISRSNKDHQKRLETLKRQLYGKDRDMEYEVRSLEEKENLGTGFKLNLGSISTSPKPVIAQDTNYLQKDLLKIFMLASIAFAVQFALKLILKL